MFGLLLLMLGVCYGLETSCDGRKNRAQCFGVLGGSVHLQLMDDASEILRYRWRKDSRVILDGRKGTFVTDLTDNRFSFSPSNGTFRINNLSRNDGGNYTLEIYDSIGAKTATQTLQLIIQAPVSSVKLVSECLSQGEMRVSCSSEVGDSPQYSWTLNGRKLRESQLYSGNHETKNITLKQDVSGQLVCTVKNQVSGDKGEKMISTCGFKFFDCTLTNGTNIKQWLRPTNETLCIEPTTTPEGYLPIMGGVLFVMLVLLAVGVGVVYAQKKRQNKPKEDIDEQELTYADIKVVPRQGRQIHRAEREVEYGQVKFSQRPRPPVEPAGDECVYSMVRKGR
ncbi:HEPACAM family member 2-like isoform X3 [Halichoeres trimaculatus]|uniref:HEPACAM family member 2-like isoform X3 n=1 Tax=Halichoeres trimaculatus TaxID=147232 RepID=UPI003D9DD424